MYIIIYIYVYIYIYIYIYRVLHMTFMESLNKLFPNGSAIRGRPSQMISCLLEKRWLLHEIPSGKLTEGTSPF